MFEAIAFIKKISAKRTQTYTQTLYLAAWLKHSSNLLVIFTDKVRLHLYQSWRSQLSLVKRQAVKLCLLSERLHVTSVQNYQ
ncbi:MAG: hypothetical protein N4J56_001345 [Chroococcidiopsis sp. SAG 2025]|nr:hypothetical protein [Chroococcidiopsis sp. SAG 2025]